MSRMRKKKRKNKAVTARTQVQVVVVVILLLVCFFLVFMSVGTWTNKPVRYTSGVSTQVLSTSSASSGDLDILTGSTTSQVATTTILGGTESVSSEVVLPVMHQPLPDAVKGIYMTACVASTEWWREDMADLVVETELNSLIIDIKDYSGTISIDTGEYALEGEKASGCYVRDMQSFINYLHSRDIYIIGRITVFQDPYYATRHPEVAVQKASDKSVWTDHKGISFVDAGAKEYWDYIVTLSKVAYEMGFDELNYDYIRFPSDGDMKDIYYPISEERVVADWQYGKAKIIRDFFAYLYEEMKDTGAYLSADLFGMTATNKDDLNIGQILEFAIPYFDFVAPMVYPSHYPTGFSGYQNVNAVPYEIVNYSMETAVERVREMALSTTTDFGGRGVYDPLQLRPWLQDNDYPVPYTPDMVRAQIDATYDAGLTSWMLWDAGNTYTREALEPAAGSGSSTIPLEIIDS